MDSIYTEPQPRPRRLRRYTPVFLGTLGLSFLPSFCAPHDSLAGNVSLSEDGCSVTIAGKVGMVYETIWAFNHMGAGDGLTLPYSDDSFEYSLRGENKRDAHVTVTLYDRDSHEAIDQVSTHLRQNTCQESDTP